MKRPRIGMLAGRIINQTHPWMSVVYGQSQAYCDAIVHAGGTPLILPQTSNIDALHSLYEVCDGLLLAGGNDVDPALYGQARHDKTQDVDCYRDDAELQLLSWALDDDMPVLAICRGMQLLNIQLGGTLHQHIPEALPEARNHEVSKQHQNTTQIAHQLQLKAGSKLATIVNETVISTNSQHHQAVARLGTGLSANAWAEDGVIEGLELSGKRFVVAVQSHPEGLEAETEPKWRRLFEAFIGATQN